MKKVLVLILIIFLTGHFLLGQDIHFSQYYHAQQYINPSFTGLPPSIYRVSLHSKNQWLSITKPYQTYLTSFDASFRINKLSSDYFSTGALIYYDVAGDANLSLTKFSPFLSYTFFVSENINGLLTIGIQPGIAQRNMNFYKLYFDSQFDGHTYNPNLPSNEQIQTENYFYADIGVGAHYIHFIDRETRISGGLSLFNINKPNVSFKGAHSLGLDRKFIFHAEGRLPYKTNFLLPSLYFASQGTHKEFIFGSRFMIPRSDDQFFKDNIFFRNNIILGLFYRTKDAFIAYVGGEVQNIHLGLTYDINFSQLTPASHARGGFELSVSYIWKPSKIYKTQEMLCPIF